MQNFSLRLCLKGSLYSLGLCLYLFRMIQSWKSPNKMFSHQNTNPISSILPLDLLKKIEFFVRMFNFTIRAHLCGSKYEVRSPF